MVLQEDAIIFHGETQISQSIRLQLPWHAVVQPVNGEKMRKA